MEYWDGLLKTPYYLVDETLLKQNLEILREVSGRAGCKILLAQKKGTYVLCYRKLN